MNKFIPFKEDVPLSYAYEHAEYYRNKPREIACGGTVYFFPPNQPVGQFGEPGPGYAQNKPYNENQGNYGNCTWYYLARVYETTGIILFKKSIDAFKIYSEYNGRRDGGNFNGQNLFDTIQVGDGLIYADSKSKPGLGHVNYVEAKYTDHITVSESGASRNAQYKNKTCIVYDIYKDDLITGNSIKLRPKSPYYSVFYGVVHTGDYLYPKLEPVEKDITKNQIYSNVKGLNIRKEPNTTSTIIGTLPNGYFDVQEVIKKSDFTWFNLGDCYVAQVNGVEYYEAKKEKETYEELYYEAIAKLTVAEDKLNKIEDILKDKEK